MFQYGFQVIDLPGSAPAQIGTPRFQDRVGHFGFDQCGGRHAGGEIVVDGALFDQCQLDVVDHDGFIGHGIKILDDLETGCRVFAADDEIAAAAGDFDVQRRLNLAQVFIQRAAQIGQPVVVDGFRCVIQDIRIVLVFAFHNRSVRLIWGECSHFRPMTAFCFVFSRWPVRFSHGYGRIMQGVRRRIRHAARNWPLR